MGDGFGAQQGDARGEHGRRSKPSNAQVYSWRRDVKMSPQPEEKAKQEGSVSRTCSSRRETARCSCNDVQLEYAEDPSALRDLDVICPWLLSALETEWGGGRCLVADAGLFSQKERMFGTA